MEYRTSEMAAMMGVSAQTLRFYEQYGMQQFTRGEDNQYRNFNDANVDVLMSLRKLRNMGYTVAQAMDVLNCPVDVRLQDMLTERKAALERDIQRMQLMMEAIEESVNEIGEIARGEGRPAACMSPELYGSAFSGERKEDLVEHGEWAQWMPLIRWMYRFSPEELRAETAYPRMGYAMTPQISRFTGLEKSERLFHMPPLRCMRVGISWTGGKLGLHTALREITRREFDGKGVVFSGDVFGVTTWNTHCSGEKKSYGTFYFPV